METTSSFQIKTCVSLGARPEPVLANEAVSSSGKGAREEKRLLPFFPNRTGPHDDHRDTQGVVVEEEFIRRQHVVPEVVTCSEKQ